MLVIMNRINKLAITIGIWLFLGLIVGQPIMGFCAGILFAVLALICETYDKPN